MQLIYLLTAKQVLIKMPFFRCRITYSSTWRLLLVKRAGLLYLAHVPLTEHISSHNRRSQILLLFILRRGIDDLRSRHCDICTLHFGNKEAQNREHFVPVPGAVGLARSVRDFHRDSLCDHCESVFRDLNFKNYAKNEHLRSHPS